MVFLMHARAYAHAHARAHMMYRDTFPIFPLVSKSRRHLELSGEATFLVRSSGGRWTFPASSREREMRASPARTESPTRRRLRARSPDRSPPRSVLSLPRTLTRAFLSARGFQRNAPRCVSRRKKTMPLYPLLTAAPAGTRNIPDDPPENLRTIASAACSAVSSSHVIQRSPFSPSIVRDRPASAFRACSSTAVSGPSAAGNACGVRGAAASRRSR